jgi:hypothetical protein
MYWNLRYCIKSNPARLSSGRNRNNSRFYIPYRDVSLTGYEARGILSFLPGGHISAGMLDAITGNCQANFGGCQMPLIKGEA